MSGMASAELNLVIHLLSVLDTHELCKNVGVAALVWIRIITEAYKIILHYVGSYENVVFSCDSTCTNISLSLLALVILSYCICVALL